jgi:nucleoside-diphosphate-sugar epimerase
MQHHLVIGSGPVGSGIAQRLADQGSPVTVFTRSGTGPVHPSITLAKGDAVDAAALARHAEGAATIFNCANPPYHRWGTDWPPMHQAIMTAAERTGAVVVMMDNLYAFGTDRPMPMKPTDPLLATGEKGSVRARMATELLAAHAAGRLRATLARASDFYGPGVVDASLGERVVPRVLAGKKVSVLGRVDVPHSVTYMPDVVATMVTIATDERAWGQAWHVPRAPAVSQRDAVQALAKAALKEVLYQFDKPWIIDASLTEQTFGLAATPLAEGAAATVAWWRQRLAA